MRKVYILPNLFTAASLFCGMSAIYQVVLVNPLFNDVTNEDLKQACWLILIAAFLDVCDGAIARLTRTTSAFGLNFDSLSDLVAFGVAPALLTYHSLAEFEHNRMIATSVCSLFAICGALRLARFNVQAMREERKTFTGLPIPAAAMAVVALNWILSNERAMMEIIPFKAFAPPFMVIIAYLMVSKVPYKGFKSMQLAGRQPFEILLTIIFISILLFMLKSYLDILLAAMVWTYLSVGLLFWLVRGRTQPVEKQMAAPAADSVDE